MNQCKTCHGDLDWSSIVGEYDIRQWHIGKAIGDKGFICQTCLYSILAHIGMLMERAKA
jgi:hypothetical protein